MAWLAFIDILCRIKNKFLFILIINPRTGGEHLMNACEPTIAGHMYVFQLRVYSFQTMMTAHGTHI